MTAIAILIPVLNRPARVKPLVAGLAAASRFIECKPIFLTSPGDHAELAAIKEAQVYDDDGDENLFVLPCDWDPDAGDYARKINRGAAWVALGGFEFVFLAADDLVFHPGWAERALATHLETRACVVGTWDGGNANTETGHHSTHTLVHVDYLECGTIDEPDSGKLLHEGYDHNQVDVEFVGTAKHRQTWAHASDCLVEHQHPIWGTAPPDATYEKAQRAYAADRDLLNARRALWERP